MDVETKRITDIFHAFANCEGDDSFSRLHVHRLNTTDLKKHDFDNELVILQSLMDWLKTKPFIRMLLIKKVKLCLNIHDANLSCGADRQFETHHIIALRYKE